MAPESCTENGVKIEIQRNRRRHFVDRPNRFIAHVEVNGAVETVHVKNTGRCKELLLPGTAVRLEVSDNPKRKTKYDLVAVHKQGLGWVNMDSQAPNKVVGEWLAKQGYDYIKPEFTYGKSRIDFYMERANRNICWKSRAAHWKWTVSATSRMHLPSAA